MWHWKLSEGTWDGALQREPYYREWMRTDGQERYMNGTCNESG